jgi:methionyl-tRNA synthetase
VDANKPWELAKNADNNARLQEVCSRLLEAFRILTIYLKPVLPALAAKVEAQLNISELSWADVNTPMADQHKVNAYEHLMQRVDIKVFDDLFDPPAPAALLQRQNLQQQALNRLPKKSKLTTSPKSICVSPKS